MLSFVDAVGVVDRLAYQRFGTITATAPVEVSPPAAHLLPALVSSRTWRALGPKPHLVHPGYKASFG
jgi:hypothetical protein